MGDLTIASRVQNFANVVSKSFVGIKAKKAYQGVGVVASSLSEIVVPKIRAVGSKLEMHHLQGRLQKEIHKNAKKVTRQTSDAAFEEFYKGASKNIAAKVQAAFSDINHKIWVERSTPEVQKVYRKYRDRMEEKYGVQSPEKGKEIEVDNTKIKRYLNNEIDAIRPPVYERVGDVFSKISTALFGAMQSSLRLREWIQKRTFTKAAGDQLKILIEAYSTDQLKQMFVTGYVPKSTIQNIQKALETESKDPVFKGKSFSQEEIKEHFHNMLEHYLEKELKKEEMQDLKDERKVLKIGQEMMEASEEDMKSLQENLMQIPSEKFPFRVLAKIPVTEKFGLPLKHYATVESVWRKLIADLKQKVDQEDLPLFKRKEAALKFIEGLAYMRSNFSRRDSELSRDAVEVKQFLKQQSTLSSDTLHEALSPAISAIFDDLIPEPCSTLVSQIGFEQREISYICDLIIYRLRQEVGQGNLATAFASSVSDTDLRETILRVMKQKYGEEVAEALDQTGIPKEIQICEDIGKAIMRLEEIAGSDIKNEKKKDMDMDTLKTYERELQGLLQDLHGKIPSISDFSRPDVDPILFSNKALLKTELEIQRRSHQTFKTSNEKIVESLMNDEKLTEEEKKAKIEQFRDNIQFMIQTEQEVRENVLSSIAIVQHLIAVQDAKAWPDGSLNIKNSSEFQAYSLQTQNYIREIAVKGELNYIALSGIQPRSVAADVVVSMWREITSSLMNKIEEAAQRNIYTESAAQNLIVFGNEYIKAFEGMEKALDSLDEASKKKLQSHIHNLEERMELQDVSAHVEAAKKSLDEMAPTLKSDLTFNEKRGLQMLSRCWNMDQAYISQAERREICEFVRYAMNNVRFNKKLGKLLESSEAMEGMNRKAIEAMRRFSYKSDRLARFPEFADKLLKNWDRLANNIPIDPSQRITIEELGSIEQGVSITSEMEKFQKMGIFDLDAASDAIPDEKNAELLKLSLFFKECSRCQKQASEVLEIMEAKLHTDAEFKSGDLIMTSLERQNKIEGRLKRRDRLQQTFITKYGHAAKIYRALDWGRNVDELMLSHLNGPYFKEKLNLQGVAASDIYRLDISKLLRKDQISKLIELYGPDWKKKIQDKYHSIELELHSSNRNTRFANIHISNKALRKAGLSKFMFFDRFKQAKHDFRKVHDDILSIEEQKEMICSEFAARTTIAALIELNDVLSMKLYKDMDHNVLDIPISRNEKLSRLHPGRLMHALKNKDCIIKIDPPLFLKEMMDFG